MVISAPAIKPVNPIEYPSSDGEPVAETYDHFYAIAILLEMLRQYLTGRQATVLGNQYLYYAQGLPRMRVAPDVMVIFEVAAGGRDNYKFLKLPPKVRRLRILALSAISMLRWVCWNIGYLTRKMNG